MSKKTSSRAGVQRMTIMISLAWLRLPAESFHLTKTTETETLLTSKA